MKSKYLWIMAILAIIISWSLFHDSPAQKTGSGFGTDAVAATNSSVQVLASNAKAAQPSVAATNSNGSGLESVVKDIDQRYHQGMISKDQAILETIKAENLKLQDFYGKAIDQYDQPVASVAVTGELILNDGTYGGISVKNYATTTDSNGLFEFTGLHGAKLSILVKKEGYKMGERGEGYKGPIGSQTSPTDRAILTMWKIRGPEPLVNSGIDAKIPRDGSPTTFDIATGKESADGNLRVTFSRFPLEVLRRNKFDWTAKVEILNGGLVEENDPYPYLAPENGYQPSFEFNVSSNDVPWHPYLDGNFYIKNSQGQYGLMKLHINSSVTPARLKAGFTINPSGSQNLEPNFSK